MNSTTVGSWLHAAALLGLNPGLISELNAGSQKAAVLCALLSRRGALGSMKGAETAVSCICHCPLVRGAQRAQSPPIYCCRLKSSCTNPKSHAAASLPVRAPRCQCEKLPAAFARPALTCISPVKCQTLLTAHSVHCQRPARPADPASPLAPRRRRKRRCRRAGLSDPGLQL